MNWSSLRFSENGQKGFAMYDKLINYTYKYGNMLFHFHSNFTKLPALKFDFCLLQRKIHWALKYWKLILKSMKSHDCKRGTGKTTSGHS